MPRGSSTALGRGRGSSCHPPPPSDILGLSVAHPHAPQNFDREYQRLYFQPLPQFFALLGPTVFVPSDVMHWRLFSGGLHPFVPLKLFRDSDGRRGRLLSSSFDCGWSSPSSGRPPRLMGRHSALYSGPIGVISPDRPMGGTSLASSPLRRSIYCFVVLSFWLGGKEGLPLRSYSLPRPPSWLGCHLGPSTTAVFITDLDSIVRPPWFRRILKS